jgi:glucose-1-phosphate cytidylyltransferase
MKVVILAGGLGTRISEETSSQPKPMIRIGNDPILVHILRHYAHYNHEDFIIALGYKGYAIKEYFKNYLLHTSNISINLLSESIKYETKTSTNWNLQLVDTGDSTLTGGRVKRLQSRLNETFMLTYGDGLSDVNLDELLKFHKAHGKLATVTAVAPPGRYGILEISESNSVNGFLEKPREFGSLINGGFFVFEPGIFDLIDGDDEPLEEGLLPKLSKLGELFAFRHSGFWQSMDTLRDMRYLESLITSGNTPWIATN